MYVCVYSCTIRSQAVESGVVCPFVFCCRQAVYMCVFL